MKPKPNFDYPIHELLQKRWSPRAFSNKPIENSILMSLFEAARWAASAMNEQPWRFIYATKANKDIYEKLLSCLADSNKLWANSAPILAMTLIKTNFDYNNSKNEWALHDLGLAIGNLTTQASSLDIFVHHMAGFSIENAIKTFGISSEIKPVTMLAIGYLGNSDLLPEQLKEREVAKQERKPLNDLFIK